MPSCEATVQLEMSQGSPCVSKTLSLSRAKEYKLTANLLIKGSTSRYMSFYSATQAMSKTYCMACVSTVSWHRVGVKEFKWSQYCRGGQIYASLWSKTWASILYLTLESCLKQHHFSFCTFLVCFEISNIVRIKNKLSLLLEGNLKTYRTREQ